MTIQPGLRTPALPIEHLDAELLAAPFASDSAFASVLTQLAPQLDGPTVPLWRETERKLLYHFPGMSIDELVIRRDHAWFGTPRPGSAPVPLDAVLRRAAEAVVDPDAGVARLRVDPEKPERVQRRRWRWLSFSLPPDLLLAAAGAHAEHVEQVSAKLQAQLREDGVAESHLHLRAALSFPQLWANFMGTLARPDAKSDMLQSPGAERDEGRELAPLMQQCALARLLLAAYLRRPDWHERGFRAYLEQHAGPRLLGRFGELARRQLWLAMLELATGRAADPVVFPLRRALYARLIGPRVDAQTNGLPCHRTGFPTASAQRSGEAARLDPINGWFRGNRERSPDFAFTAAALAHLHQFRGRDTLFATLFWQTLRGRVMFYRHVVQRPMVPGLQWFSRTYGRLSAPRRGLDNDAFVRQAVELAGPGARAVEVRVTPEDRMSDLRRLVCTVDEEARAPARHPGSPPPEVGVVFHFSRSRGDAAVKGRPAAWSRGGHDDPSAVRCNPTGYRFSGYYREQRVGAGTLGNLLFNYPRMLERVRAIDLCTDELGVPLWVLLPLVRYVLRAGDCAAAFLRRREGRRCAPAPLSVTVHAGEDFVHLMGGIRRVHEAIELLGLGENARLGHAVALGVDVREWAARAGQLLLPRGERLLDLLWVWRVVRRAPEPLRSWLPWVDQELVRLGYEVFGVPVTAHDLERWWKALHQEVDLRAVGFPSGPRPSMPGRPEEPRSLLYAWLTDRGLFERAQVHEPIEVGQEVPLVVALQAHVRGVVASRGIAVEINPSSNLLIGHLGDLTSHPLWRLCPPPGVATDAPGVRVCIGSDDPITFATSLPEEYQLLADALAEAGLAGSDVDAWLNAARQCSLTSRFTLPRSGKRLDQPLRAGVLPVPL